MQWIKAFHIIFVVTWFAGLFYLPRLFVYHALSNDDISLERFKVMEHKLFYYITFPSAILATLFGLWLLGGNWRWYLSQDWMLAKLALVGLLWIYHLLCWKYVRNFNADSNIRSHGFYRAFNEFPVIILIAVVIFVVVKP